MMKRKILSCETHVIKTDDILNIIDVILSEDEGRKWSKKIPIAISYSPMIEIER
jgi:hypothetical protein